eukprot:CAMPEP_0170547640 /NCGR_PEP_ID=MMETSP0211-20121228/6027_1 /TAXON_ID=311385 /ORGANISM="Pseudokeronopsis sp., Strain OXSARD2" /LENGTH=95 /DNA_ID=CAMNT_0010852787 /DNA_START=455 /DNA_END=742 /DNA_ORIENTATION=-
MPPEAISFHQNQSIDQVEEMHNDCPFSMAKTERGRSNTENHMFQSHKLLQKITEEKEEEGALEHEKPHYNKKDIMKKLERISQKIKDENSHFQDQ